MSKNEKEDKDELIMIASTLGIILPILTSAGTAGSDSQVDEYIVGTTLIGTGLSVTSSFAGSSDGGIVMYEDSLGNIHIDDAGSSSKVEYSKVERVAEKIYNKFSKDKDSNDEKKEIVTCSTEVAELIKQIIDSNDRDTLIVKLTALEEILKEDDITDIEPKSRNRVN